MLLRGRWCRLLRKFGSARLGMTIPPMFANSCAGHVSRRPHVVKPGFTPRAFRTFSTEVMPLSWGCSTHVLGGSR